MGAERCLNPHLHLRLLLLLSLASPPQNAIPFILIPHSSILSATAAVFEMANGRGAGGGGGGGGGRGKGASPAHRDHATLGDAELAYYACAFLHFLFDVCLAFFSMVNHAMRSWILFPILLENHIISQHHMLAYQCTAYTYLLL